MSNELFPALNDVEPSWADIEVSCPIYSGPLIQMTDISAIKWGRSTDLGVRRGTGGRKMARTSGQPDCEASWTLYQGGYLKLLRGLMSVAPTRGPQVLVGRVGFDVVIEYTPFGSLEIFRVKIKGCRLTSDGSDAAEGPDASLVEVGLNPIDVVNIIDGKEVALT